MNAEANAAKALEEIERNLQGTFDPNPPRLHERPKIVTRPGDPLLGQAIPAAPTRNLPALLAELQATIDAVQQNLEMDVASRLTRIEAFLGLEP